MKKERKAVNAGEERESGIPFSCVFIVVSIRSDGPYSSAQARRGCSSHSRTSFKLGRHVIPEASLPGSLQGCRRATLIIPVCIQSRFSIAIGAGTRVRTQFGLKIHRIITGKYEASLKTRLILIMNATNNLFLRLDTSTGATVS